jgi:hypothetical protein
MDCEYCKKKLSSLSSLNYHKKNTKSCLKLQGVTFDKKVNCEFCNIVLSSKISLQRHVKICKYKYKNIEYDLHDALKKIEMLNSIISELRSDKNELLTDYKDLAITAVKRPTSTKNVHINNYIKNMSPLLDSDIKKTIPMLTLEHHVKGAEGYAQYALEFPFKNKIVTVDIARNKIKYKNEEGDIIEDVGFKKMMTKLCSALKDRSFNLSQEHYEKLSEKFSDDEMGEFDFMDTAMAITKYANGRESDFCRDIIRMIGKGSTVL